MTAFHVKDGVTVATGASGETRVARLGADGDSLWRVPLLPAGLPWAIARSGELPVGNSLSSLAGSPSTNDTVPLERLFT